VFAAGLRERSKCCAPHRPGLLDRCNGQLERDASTCQLSCLSTIYQQAATPEFAAAIAAGSVLPLRRTVSLILRRADSSSEQDEETHIVSNLQHYRNDPVV